MKYTIEGLSQERLVEWGLDAVDSILLRWFIDFWPVMEKKTVRGKEYGWVAYSHVIDELPIMGIENTEAIARRFKKYRTLKLMAAVVDREDNSKTFFRFEEERYNTLVSSKSRRLESSRPPDSKVAGPATQKSNNPSSSDSSSNDPGEEESKLASQETASESPLSPSLRSEEEETQEAEEAQTFRDKLQAVAREVLGAETPHVAKAESLVAGGEDPDTVLEAWELMLTERPAGAPFFDKDYATRWKPKVRGKVIDFPERETEPETVKTLFAPRLPGDEEKVSKAAAGLPWRKKATA